MENLVMVHPLTTSDPSRSRFMIVSDLGSYRFRAAANVSS